MEKQGLETHKSKSLHITEHLVAHKREQLQLIGENAVWDQWYVPVHTHMLTHADSSKNQ